MKDHPISKHRRRRPDLVVFDVNETLSDMSPLAGRFEDVGAPSVMARTWFAELLRDGFALTVSGEAEAFARLAAEALRLKLEDQDLDRDLEDAVEHVLSGFPGLTLHPDVAEGLHALADLGVRLVTLSNGSAQVAERLLEHAGVRPLFERLLSVEEAGIWKPASGAYDYALGECGVDAQDAVLVAAHPWDIHGASRAGLGTAWVNRAQGRYPAYFAAPGLSVSSLPELAQAFTHEPAQGSASGRIALAEPAARPGGDLR